MPEITLKAPSGECLIRIGRRFAHPDLSMDRISPERFVVADAGASSIARPWMARRPALVLPGGERCKNLAVVLKVVRALLRSGHERTRPIVAVGGGALCDLAGFAASIYHRGVPLHLVPTTLLAQVDAAIGGKNGIDLPEGKNLLGTIRQPQTVLVDPLVLARLPAREFVSGLAEVIKYGIACDPQLFELLENRIDAVLKRDPAVLLEVLTRCIVAKVAVVEKDEQDHGGRAVLNYGHTFGHAIETASRFRMSHGEAIAVGMEAAGLIAAKLGLARATFLERQHRVLESGGLSTRLAGARPADILRAMERDKKRAGGRHRFVLAEEPGHVHIGVEVEDRLAREALAAVMAR